MATVTISKPLYDDLLKSLAGLKQQFTGLSDNIHQVSPPVADPIVVEPPVVEPPVVDPPVVNQPVVSTFNKLLYISQHVNDLNITKTSFGSGAWNGNEVTCRYPKGSCAGNKKLKGGYGFYATPKDISGQNLFPCTEVVFQYDVLFDPDFDWVKGGKLPGLYGGRTGAAGGNHIDNGMSCRLMWRAGGDAEIYLYVPDSQDSVVDDVSSGNGSKGLSVGRGQFKLVKGIWQTLRMHIKLNDVGQMNGVLELWHNDKLCISLNSFNFRSQDLSLSGIFFDTFFGGGDTSWASTRDTYAKFRNLSLYGSNGN